MARRRRRNNMTPDEIAEKVLPAIIQGSYEPAINQQVLELMLSLSQSKKDMSAINGAIRRRIRAHPNPLFAARAWSEWNYAYSIFWNTEVNERFPRKNTMSRAEMVERITRIAQTGDETNMAQAMELLEAAFPENEHEQAAQEVRHLLWLERSEKLKRYHAFGKKILTPPLKPDWVRQLTKRDRLNEEFKEARNTHNNWIALMHEADERRTARLLREMDNDT